ncbi:MAG: aminoacyl-tRNA hydrolase [Gammaproteobacteria bacterium]|nr:MAG: aminoacyl-tRNA hydrolase [Gammaproteobacteria bacterium]
MSTIRLIAGLGNPGPQYEQTRHNAGAWLIEALARRYQLTLKADRKYSGLTTKLSLPSGDVHLIIPTTFMNRSGQAVQSLANYFKIMPEEILVAHDELDFPAGTVRLKQSGGHGGHNGLRDIINKLSGDKDFYRLRIGIGHPGDKKLVHDYVLSRPSVSDRKQMEHSIEDIEDVIELIISGDMGAAMNKLHTTS